MIKLEDYMMNGKLEISDQTFFHSNLFDLSLDESIVGNANFLEARFEEIDLMVSDFSNCSFKNCKFVDINFF